MKKQQVTEFYPDHSGWGEFKPSEALNAEVQRLNKENWKVIQVIVNPGNTYSILSEEK